MFPEDAAVVAAKLASGVEAKAIIEAISEQTDAIEKATAESGRARRHARVAAHSRGKSKADKVVPLEPVPDADK
jgi:hypothetical protein